MASPNPIEYSDASIEIREIYDEIKLARGIEDVSNLLQSRCFLLKFKNNLVISSYIIFI